MISGFVLIAGLLGMLTTLLSTLNERRREMAVLRAVGAHPYHIILCCSCWKRFLLFLAGCLVGVSVLYLLAVFDTAVSRPSIRHQYRHFFARYTAMAAVYGRAVTRFIRQLNTGSDRL